MLIGDARENLRHAFATGRVAHAYLFAGSPRGAAAELAVFTMQLLACGEKNAPCGACDTCRQIAARTWCDAFWLSPMKKSRIISVNQMRRGHGENDVPEPYFLPWLSQTSLLGGWKFGVVVNADRMHDAAANALLKTLEEPPGKTMLLLLTDAPQQLLPTIRSRCCLVELSEPPAELPGEYFGPLMEVLSASTLSGPLAANAMASRLLSILGAMHDDAEKEIKADVNEDEEGGLEIDKDQREALVAACYKGKRAVLVATLLRWFRDLMAVQAGGDDSVVHYRDFIAPLRERAARLTLAQALANVEAIEEISRQFERNIPESTILAYWLDRLYMGTPS